MPGSAGPVQGYAHLLARSSHGGFEEVLETVGRWTKVERVVRAESEATTVALDFRIVQETNVGEMWIDDVSLEPIGCSTTPDSP